MIEKIVELLVDGFELFAHVAELGHKDGDAFAVALDRAQGFADALPGSGETGSLSP